MSRILVTGAAGFIGFHTARRLLEQGHDVLGIDNLSPYYDVDLKKARLAILKSENGFSFTLADIHDAEAVHRIFEQAKPEYVLHLAAQTGVRHSLDAPRDYLDANLSGFLNVLEGARHHRVRHLMYASSSSVYGANQHVPFGERDRVDCPMSLYGATKRANELMAYSYAHLYRIPTTGLRLFTVYGPWGRPDMAYYLFSEAIVSEKPIKVFNEGRCSRDFTYIDDVVYAVNELLFRPPADSPPSRLLNVGRGEPVSLLKMIALLEENLGKTTAKELLPMQPGDVEATHANIDALDALVPNRPGISLAEGIARFADWYRSYRALDAR